MRLNMKKENTIESYIIKKELDMPRIFDDYYNYIITIIKNKHSINIEDEEEIISDVFTILWKNKGKLDRKAMFSPYIAGITKKVIYRKYKEFRQNIEFSEYEENIVSNFNIDKVIEEKEINDCITKNLKEIGQTEYEIFRKFYYEGKRQNKLQKKWI